MAKYRNQQMLRDGRILLYQDANLRSPVWQARLRVPGIAGYIVRSTKFANLAESTRFAEELFDELRFKAKNNLPIRQMTFKAVWEEFLTHIETSLSVHRVRLHKTISNRYFVPYFGAKAMEHISEQTISGYWEWRLSYWTDGPGKTEKVANASRTPSKKTIEIEKSNLNQIFKYAKRKNYISALPLIEVPKVRREGGKESGRRPGFSPQEVKRLKAYMDEWIAGGRHSLHQHQRGMIRCIVLFLLETGLRPNELFQLRWCDIDLHEDSITLHIAPTTKTGERQAVFHPDLMKILLKVGELNGIYIPSHLLNILFDKPWLETEEQPSTGFVFADKEGEPLVWAGKTFKAMLKEAKLLKDAFGRERTLYSLRHTYASERLLDGIPMDALAKNLGTSVAYIERHYDHTTNLDKWEVLTKRRG